MRLSPGLPPARRWVLALTVTSFLGWSTWELTRPPTNAFMDLSGWFTDHFSHMNAGRLFFRFGPDVWRVPLNRLLPRPTAAQLEALPDDVKRCRDCLFVAPGWEKPVVQSWPHVVRFYPPGDMVLTAPVAVLYHFTPLSFTNANRLLLVILLGAAHLGLFLLLDGLLSAPPEVRYSSLLAGFLGVNFLLRWTLEGFYDSALLFPLLLCWRYLGQRRGLAAGVAFCAAAFLHFRAYYYAPWAIWAAAMVVRERQWRTWTPRDWTAAGAAALLGGASLTTYFLALPGLLAVDQLLSPLLITKAHVVAPALWVAAAVGAVAVAAFFAASSRIDAAMAGWIGLVLTQVRQSLAWYPLAAVPWMVSPPRPGRPERAPLVMEARVLVFLFLVLYVHGERPYAFEAVIPTWILRLLR